MNKNLFLEIVSPLSITSRERIEKLYDELEYIRKNNIYGDLVECGVYRGGNILGMMKYCEFFNLNKTIWIYDTFNGMTPPTDIDTDYLNNKAADQLDQVMCKATFVEVQKNLAISKYNNIKYVIGDVCETLRVLENIPHTISLLRLDTDWFESTLCELNVLFPRIIYQGSLIIDDYGHWNGCKKAVDTYFQGSNYKYEHIDYTGLCIRKTS